MTNWTSYIDAGNAVINASGYGVSSEYNGWGWDFTRIQFIFLNSGKSIISTALDSTYILNENDVWWKNETLMRAVPANTRYLRIWANSYENCGAYYCNAGSADSFSVKLGYMA